MEVTEFGDCKTAADEKIACASGPLMQCSDSTAFAPAEMSFAM